MCLAGLLLGRYDVLLLDEPTNHLDVETVGALAEALRSFTGTVLFVSHDRIFTAAVSTHLLEVEAGAFGLYPGDYDAYCAGLDQVKPTPPAAPVAKASPPPPPVRPDRARQRQMERVERRIAELAAERAAIEAALAERYDADQGSRLAAVLAAQELVEAEWLELSG